MVAVKGKIWESGSIRDRRQFSLNGAFTFIRGDAQDTKLTALDYCLLSLFMLGEVF